MVQIIYREPPPVPAGPAPDPYAMVEVIVGDKSVLARPYEFTAEVVADGRDAAGQPVLPVKLSTSCPECGHGLTVVMVGRHAHGACECGLEVTNQERRQHEDYIAQWRAAPVIPVKVVASCPEPELDPFRCPFPDALPVDQVPVDQVVGTKTIEARVAETPQLLGSLVDLGPEPDDV